MRVRRRIPHRRRRCRCRMPVSTSARLRSRPSSPIPSVGRADLRGVGRRHRGDPVGEREAGLEVADRAVILDAVDRIGVRRQADPGEEVARVLALERQVVHRHDRAGPRRAAVMEQCGNEARLPVVRVDDVGRVTGDGAARDRRGARRRAPRSEARCRAIPSRRARRRCCRRARRDAARRARRDRGPRRARQEAAPDRRAARRTCARSRRPSSAASTGGYPGIERARVDAFARERRRQRADDVGQAPGLDQRKDLRRDREDVRRRI